MINGRASQSAQMVAVVRAAHVAYDDSPPIFNDHLALDLMDPSSRTAMPQWCPPNKGDDGGPSGYAYVPFRQHYAEEGLKAAYQKGIRQYVILGAGLDSYAFRQPNEQTDLQIFEVDHPDTQTHKRQRISELDWITPINLIFTPCDFEQTKLRDALHDVGFDRTQPTFFSWLGVTMYLSPESVSDSFAEVAWLSSPDSEIAFEFGLPTATLLGDELKRRQAGKATKYRKDEPYIFFCEAETIKKMALDAGFLEVITLDHEAEETRLLSNRKDHLSFRIGMRLAKAKI